jgi:hypothetical protein
VAKNKGICAICGRGGKLTFEHVPPKAAGNEPDVTIFSIEEWLARDLASRELPGGYVEPRGTGAISICRSCNEYSGTWYVPEFARFVHAGVQVLREISESTIDEADRSLEWKYADFEIKGMRALPIIKQIVASLLAINAPSFGEAHPDLVKFVLDRHRQNLPDRYRLYLCLFVGPIARFAGVSAALDVATGKAVYLTELAHPPFAYLLTMDSEPSPPIGEITVWTTRSLDEARDERLVLTLGFGHTPLPGDYRSKAKLDVDKATNNAGTSDHDGT